MLQQARQQWGLQVQNGGGAEGGEQGLEPVSQAISLLPGPEETF